MRLLWLINIPLPEASILMKEKPLPFGGWLINAAKNLANQDGIELSIAFPSSNVSYYEKLSGSKIVYYAFKAVSDNDISTIKSNIILKKIIDEAKPDLVHIYGTELAHSLSMINVCNDSEIETIISIQGLVSIIEKHMNANLPLNVIYGRTLRNILRKDNVSKLKKLYLNRGKNEIEAIRNTKHVIGRTTWDKACSVQINPEVNYHFCYETLREEFYKHQWNFDKCDKHTILLSQGQYPIKGIHYVLNAMPMILKNYPDTMVYISGKDITKSNTMKDKLLLTYYGKYIKKMISKLNLEKNVTFTGPLDEKAMCERFLKSNLFISPSTIENESNSLSEARLLGVPSIASYVGGVTDRIRNGFDGFLYQHDATYMLAYFVCEVFGNKKLALSFSEKARENALKIHDINRNTEKLIEIYKDIIK